MLCYLQGLTYDTAAHQLGLSASAVRGRLVRRRERLRRRLTGRGVTVPAGLLVAGAAGQAQAAIPLTLIHSSSRIALGFLAGNTAAVLARGALNALLLNQLRVATVLLCLSLGVGYCAWQAFATADDENGQTHARPAVVKTAGSSQPPPTDRYGDPLPPGAAMRLGTVRFRQFPHICHVVYSPDGQLVVTDTQENFLQVWDARDGGNSARSTRAWSPFTTSPSRPTGGSSPSRESGSRRAEPQGLATDLHRCGHGPSGSPGRMGHAIR